MRYLKLFEDYSSEEELVKLCKYYNISDGYEINNGLVDVSEDVSLSYQAMSAIPIPFGRVEGYFDIEYNSITDLKNSPKYVGGDFYANRNKFETLENISQTIKGTLWINTNVNFYSIKGTEDKDFSLGESFRCKETPFYEIYLLVRKRWDLGTIQEFHMQDLILTKEGDKWMCDLYYLNNFLMIMAEINQTEYKEVTKLNNYICK